MSKIQLWHQMNKEIKGPKWKQKESVQLSVLGPNNSISYLGKTYTTTAQEPSIYIYIFKCEFNIIEKN